MGLVLIDHMIYDNGFNRTEAWRYQRRCFDWLQAKEQPPAYISQPQLNNNPIQHDHRTATITTTTFDPEPSFSISFTDRTDVRGIWRKTLVRCCRRHLPHRASTGSSTMGYTDPKSRPTKLQRVLEGAGVSSEEKQRSGRMRRTCMLFRNLGSSLILTNIRYTQAANAFRLQKQNKEAGVAFEKAAAIQTRHLSEPNDAANTVGPAKLPSERVGALHKFLETASRTRYIWLTTNDSCQRRRRYIARVIHTTLQDA